MLRKYYVLIELRVLKMFEVLVGVMILFITWLLYSIGE